MRMKITTVTDSIDEGAFKRDTARFTAPRMARAMMINVVTTFEDAEVGPRIPLVQLETRLAVEHDHAS